VGESMSERQSDPRARPPDPAGTQPKVDPESLRSQADETQLTLPDGGRPALIAGHSPGRDAQDATPATAAVTAATRESTALDATAQDTAARATATLDATALGTAALDAPGTSAARSPARATPARGGPSASANRNAPRFQFLFGALGALSVAAVALAIALLRAPAPAPERPWSGWEPAADGVDPARQIAAYVAPRYRLDDGKQIVQVSGGPATFKGQELIIGMARSGQAPAALGGNNVLYQLCGDGTECSINEGKPSTERALLLAREALELALYTFRYVSGTSQVVVTIPPPPPSGASGKTSAAKLTSTGTGTTAGSGSTTSASADSTTTTRTVSHALLFTQADLAAALEAPLSATLSTVTPQVSQMDGWPDASTVKALTEPHLYDFTISETQQAGAVMLLEPPGLGG
jgi:hypothetical protein